MDKHNSWSSLSSSVYSQDSVTSSDVVPLVNPITRKDSVTSSKASTIATQDTKSLGYTPFEYWKGPRPVAYPGDKKAKPRKLPPPRIKSPAPPVQPVNALRNFKPMPEAKLRDIKVYIDSELANPRVPVPPSPRVKDRYAERQRQKRERQRQRNGLQRVEEWPGWVPDEKAVLRTASNGGEKGGRARKVRVVSPYEKRRRTSLASTAAGRPPNGRWWNPLSWRRRVWGLLASVLILSIVAAVILTQLVTTDNTPKYPDYKRLTYRVAESYNTEDFFDHFNFFTGPDPSPGGFALYTSREDAHALNLTTMSTKSAVIRVDTTLGHGSGTSSGGAAPAGRHSVRVSSKTRFDGGGLFLFDVRHAPTGCGAWPSIRLADDDNAADDDHGGSIEVMRGTNLGAAGNGVSLHTGGGCDFSDRARNMSGVATSVDCAAGIQGCGVAGNASTFGKPFNDGGGGVVALEWRAEGIRMWQFPRRDIPRDVRSGQSPDPSSWGQALADFPDTGCDVAGRFRNQSVQLDLNLCGEAAGAAYSESGCPSTCTEYVANNPQALSDAFWELGALKVFQAVDK